MIKTYALSPSKRFINLSQNEEMDIENIFRDCGVKNIAIDFEVLFECDDSYSQTLIELANKYGFNLICYGGHENEIM